eukprot:scaffold696_cov137-Skeletonema_menzelii.AAC.11
MSFHGIAIIPFEGEKYTRRSNQVEQRSFAMLTIPCLFLSIGCHFSWEGKGQAGRIRFLYLKDV